MTKEFFESNDIVILKADKSNEAPEVDALLAELGNTSLAIPYYGLFQPDKEPVHFNGVYLSPGAFLNELGADKFSKNTTETKTLPAERGGSSEPQHVSKLAP